MEKTCYPRGRPSKARELEIDKELWPYHAKSFFILKTAELTGHDRKTISKRFKKWKAKEIEEHNKKNEQEELEARIEYENLMQDQIEDQIEIRDKLRKKINEIYDRGDTIPPHLVNSENQLAKTIANFAEKRYVIKSYPGDIRWIKKGIDKDLESRKCSA